MEAVVDAIAPRRGALVFDFFPINQVEICTIVMQSDLCDLLCMKEA